MANLQDTDILPVGRGAATYKATFKDVKDSLPAVATASDTVKGVVELATAAETTTGTDGTRAVTPAGLKVELDKKIGDAPDGLAIGNSRYVRQVSTVSNGTGGFASTKTWVKETAPADATETVKGIVELASAAETATGIDGTRAVTPAGLKGELDKKIGDAPNGTVDGTVQYARQVVRAAGVNTKTWAPVAIPPGTHVGETAPANPKQGQQWFRSDLGRLYVYYDDGAGAAQWVVANPQEAVDYSKAVVKAGDTMTGNLTVPSINTGQLAGFRNQLINGAFEVWQRGIGPFSTATAGSSVYGADRWYTNDGYVPVSRYANPADMPVGFSTAIHSTAAGTFSVAQGVELTQLGSNSQFGSGTTWTLSFWARHAPGNVNVRVLGQFANNSPGAGGVSLFDTTGGTGLVAGSAWQRLSYTFTINKTAAATNTGLFIYIRAAATGEFAVTGVQLEPGPVATPFEYRPIGVELALCQRYYQQLALLGTVFSSTNADAGNADTYCPIHITPMRSFNATASPATISVGGSIGLIGANMPIKDVQYADKATARLRLAKIGATASTDVVSKIGSGVDILSLDCEL